MKNYFINATAAALIGISSLVMQQDASAQTSKPQNNIKVFIDNIYFNRHVSIMFVNKDIPISWTEDALNTRFFEESLPEGNYQITISADSCKNKTGDFSIHKGKSLELYILPKNPKDIYDLQFELRVPEPRSPKRPRHYMKQESHMMA